MYFKFKCSHCDTSLKAEEEKVGKKARCPYCSATVTIPPPAEWSEAAAAAAAIKAPPSEKAAGTAPSPQAPAAPEAPAAPQSLERPEGDGTNVSLLLSGAIGLGFAVVFYLVILLARGTYFADMFLERGWVPYVLVILLGWSIGMLILKWRKLSMQKTAMLLDVLPAEIAEDISAETLDRFFNHLRYLPFRSRESFLVSRVRLGLEHFRVRNSNPEAGAMMLSQSDIDANAVDSSYSILKVLLWAIPILGFIGTVLGISLAVGGFSGSLDKAQDLEVLKQSLNGVTGGLAVAFDTTLVALVMSLLVSFPASAMQKAEEDLLKWVDEYCNENMLKRLNDGGATEEGAMNTQSIVKTVGTAVAEKQREILEEYRSMQGQMARVQQKQVKHFEKVSATIDAGLDKMVEPVEKAMTNLTAGSEAVHVETAQSMRDVAESVRTYFSALEEGLASLNGVLEKLGEKQVVIEAVKPKRRWGLFGRK